MAEGEAQHAGRHDGDLTETPNEVHLDTPPSETPPLAKPPSSTPFPLVPPSNSLDARTSVVSSSSKELTPVASNATSKDSTPTGTPALSPVKPNSSLGSGTAASAAVTAHALAEGPSGRRGSMSAYQSSRPAPPSPVPSRRASGIALSARERASSGASSSASGHVHSHLNASTSGSSTLRRPSGSSNGNGSRPQSRIRPRSSLGTSYLTAEAIGIAPDELAPPDAPPHSASGTKLTDTPVLEGDEPAGSSAISLQSSSILAPETPAIPVTIRDYAYPTSDDRYRGIPAPISASNSRNNSGPIWHPRGSDPPRKASTASSGSAGSGAGDGRRPSGGGGFTFGGFSFGGDDNGGNGHGNGNGKEGKKGWSGLGLLGWRGFLGRKGSTGGLSSNSEEPSAEAEAEEEVDIAVPSDDYAFESSSSDAGDDGDDDSRYGVGAAEEEPKGLYRVAYTFEAEGEHEVGVEEGEVVLVKGRGGGEGWVIAVKVRRGSVSGANAATPAASQYPDGTAAGEDGDARKAQRKVDRIEGLIPEGYLERVAAEDEDEYRWMYAHADDPEVETEPEIVMSPADVDEEEEGTPQKKGLVAPSDLDLGPPRQDNAGEQAKVEEREETRITQSA